MVRYTFRREIAEDQRTRLSMSPPEIVEISTDDWEINFTELTRKFLRFAKACDFQVSEEDLCDEESTAPLFEKQDRYIEELKDKVSMLTEENQKLAADYQMLLTKMPEFEP